MSNPSDFIDVGENFLEHVGVIGMRWGRRKIRRKYSSNEIKDARSSIKSDQQQIKRLDRKGQSPVFGKTARNESKRLSTQMAGNDQVRIANLKTKGEKARILIFTLGLGSVSLARNQAIYNPKVRRGRDEVNRIVAERKAEKIVKKAEKAEKAQRKAEKVS